MDANYEFKNDILSKFPFSWKKFWRDVEVFPLIYLNFKVPVTDFFRYFSPTESLFGVQKLDFFKAQNDTSGKKRREEKLVMRVGQNPAKYINEVEKPARVTAAVLNYIPFMSGFYAESLDVLKVTLGSLIENTSGDYDLLVFDNGSCNEVQDYLLSEQRSGKIQYLMLSKKNLGKGGAWNQILAGAPGEIIAYADADVKFLPGWLPRSLEILETYPRVGMVTSRPFRTKDELFQQTIGWAEKNEEARIEKGQFIPWETFLEFNLSLGHSEDEIREIYESSEDIKLTFKDVPAVVGASHWQFVAYKSVLKEFFPFEISRPMGQVRQLDQRMNEAGYLTVNGSGCTCVNMSNTLINVPGSNRKLSQISESVGFKKKPIKFSSGKKTFIEVI